MKKAILIGCMCIFFMNYSWCQITAAEYFVDSDPGVGLGFPLAVTLGASISETFNIPTTGLSNGVHVLHIRTKNNNGTWSLFLRRFFYIEEPYIPPVQKTIEAAEYFVDHEPGVGNGFTLPVTLSANISETFNIPTTGLSSGIHILHIRIKDNNGTWSLFLRKYFYIHDTYVPPFQKIIAEAEYFVDSDPGVGIGTPVAVAPGATVDETLMVPVECLDVGDHVLHVRVKDQENVWSHYMFGVFTVEEDIVPPTSICQDVTLVLDAAGLGSIAAEDIDNGSYDACGIASLVLDRTDFDCNDVGPNTVTLTVTDNNGNESTCTSTVTVNDGINPELTAVSDRNENTDSNCEFVIPDYTGLTSSTDNCGTPTVTQSPTVGTTISGHGTVQTITLTADDGNGNTVDTTFDVTLFGTITFYADADGDGYGDPNVTVVDCTVPSGYVANSLDCDDGDETVNPIAQEICDGVDNDCDGQIDEEGCNPCADIDAPEITSIVLPLDPVDISQQINGTATVDTDDIVSSLWAWGDGTTSSGNISGNLVSGTHVFSSAGVYQVELTVINSCNDEGTIIYQYVVIYDPSSGFVTGGGWINSPEGAYIPDASLSGKANFGFVSKYKRGKSIPEGNTEFQFHAGNLNFKSTVYDWLIVAGTKAMFKGSGTINGQGDYQFILSAKDENKIGGDDTFRIKIWDSYTEIVVYDNQLGDDDNATATMVIAGGSIIVHKEGKNYARSTNSKPLPEEELVKEFKLIFWPNPSDSTFNIKLETINTLDIVHIDVFDVTGKRVYSNKFKPVNHDTFGKNLESGLYFAKVVQSGKEKIVKLVKH